MAAACECDRCKKLFSLAYISKYHIHVWSPSRGGVPLDICPDCSKELDDFFNNFPPKPEDVNPNV